MPMVRIDKKTLSVAEAAQYLGLGRTATYEAVRTGQIPSVRIGRRYLVPVAALERMLESAGQHEGSKG